jgi:hypothetical protein
VIIAAAVCKSWKVIAHLTKKESLIDINEFPFNNVAILIHEVHV